MKMVTRPLSAAAAAFVLAISMTSAPQTATAQSDNPSMVVGLIGVTSSIWPTLIAESKGFFGDAGVEVEFVTTGSSSKSLQQVAAGAINIGSSSLMDTVRAVDAGTDIVTIANGLDVSMHAMVAAKGIDTVQALKGKRVIVGGTKDITNVWWAAMARDKGLDPATDVETLYAGSTSNRFAALVAGGVEAAVLAPPTSFKAVEEGYVDLGAVASYLKDVPYLVFHANKTWAADNPKAATGFVAAHNAAIEFFYDPANRDEAAEILATQANIDKDIALQNYDLIVRINAFARGSKITDDGIKKALAVLAADGDIPNADRPVSDVYDNSYVTAAGN